MRPWYRYTEQSGDRMQRTVITPFSKIWGYGAPVTLTLIAINVALWLIVTISDSFKWVDLEFWYTWFGMTPERVFQGHIYQLVTSIFFHDGSGILHLFMNMYLLWMFGPRVERTLSSRLFIGFYMVAGVSGSILSMLMRTFQGEAAIPSVGASAAIFGILVAYAFLFRNDILLLFFVIPLRAWKLIVGFIVLETIFIATGAMEGVDHWGHLGGAAGAAIWMLILVHAKGDRTSHGWQQSETNYWRGHFVGTRSQPRGSGGKFRIISRNPRQDHDDHPEGTDDEPAPKWFEL